MRGDPYKTLFVSRLSFDATEQDLQEEFGRYGALERVGFYISVDGDMLTVRCGWCDVESG